MRERSGPRATTIRRLAVTGTLCLAGVAAVPVAGASAATQPAQRSGGFLVRWPSEANLKTLRAGDSVRVKLQSTARARASRRVAVITLSRVTKAGKPFRTVATRRMGGGTFSARLPVAGGYRISVRTAPRSRALLSFSAGPALPRPGVVVSPPGAPGPGPMRCEQGDAVQGSLEVSSAQARAGERPLVTLTNTGVTCLVTGYGFGWERYVGSAWVDIPLGRVYPAIALFLAPAATLSEEFEIPADSVPGAYRIVKRFGAPHADIAVEIAVIP